MNKRPLQILFGFILLSLLAYTVWASRQQPVTDWGGLVNRPDNWWTIATLIDAYYAFLTFYVWVLWKEPRWGRRVAWFLAIVLLGNLAMSGYILMQLKRLRTGDGMAELLARRNGVA
ncbi:MAG: DUF1475 family protein [Pseudomonadales bacterium]|nr:DUF1475 family protein [Pseudomonadales bacterium]